MAADRWKIQGCIDLLRKTTLKNLVIKGRANPESKTTRFLRSSGFTAQDVLDVLHSLEVEDYSQGPLADDKGRPHDLWVFGKEIEGIEIYIKVVPLFDNDAVATICVSFHEAEHKMKYPFRRTR